MTKEGDSSLILCIIFAFMLFIFAPFEIYLSNKGYFFFDGSEMLGYCALAFAFCFCLCVLVLSVCKKISDKLYRIIYGMFCGGTIALYLQGNWDLTDYGAWNGSEIEWSNFFTQKIVFIVVFFVLIIACAIISFCKYSSFYKFSKGFSFFLGLVLVITLATLLLTNGGLKKDKEYIASTVDELQLSQNSNFIILVLDAYDSQAFDSILNQDNCYREMFRDFTYYPDALAAYSSTDMSVPLIITGLDYKNDQLFGDYLDRGYESSRLMNWLDKNGWEKDIYFDGLMPQGSNGFGINNNKLLKRVVSDRKALMNYMYTMVLFRYMPQPIKNHFYFYADNIKGNLNSVVGDYDPYVADNFALFNEIDNITADKLNGVFQYIHVDGAHEPFNISTDFEIEDYETSYENECQGILKLVDRFLRALEAKAIYDNSVVIIMADHGYYDERQNPLFMVKGLDEHHDLIVSETPMSYHDLQNSYIDLLEHKSSGENVFNGNDESNRCYRYVPWNTHLNFDTYSGRIGEVNFTGKAWDLSGIVDNGIEYNEPEQVIIK